MWQKCIRYTPAALCLLFCLLMPFMMLSVYTQLVTLFDTAGQAPCTVIFEENGEIVTVHRVLLAYEGNTVHLTNSRGDVRTIEATDIIRSTPSSLFSRGTIYTVLAVVVTSVCMLATLIPLNAYLIQFSIEHTPKGQFRPFEAA